MRKVTSLLFAVLALSLLIPTAGSAATSDEEFFAALAPASAPEAAPAPIALGKKEIEMNATCTAVCQYGGNVSCSGSSCSAVNQSCSAQRGYATCDGFTYYCAACPNPCNKKACDLSCGGPGYGYCTGSGICVCL
jgi:hypothetical protein